MSVIGTFSSFIILAFFVLLIILAIRWISRWKTITRGYWMLGSYGVILLISVIVYYSLPISAEEMRQPDHQENFNSILYDSDNLTSLEAFKVEDWEFPFEEGTIRIETQGDDYPYMRILAERTDNDFINITYYRTPIYLDGIKVDNDFIPVNAQLESDSLSIILQEHTEELNFASFTKEFPLQQFNDNDVESGLFGSGFNIEWDEQLLYIQVPSDAEIATDSELHVEFVN